MAVINVSYKITVTEDAEHTENDKVTEVSQVVRDQTASIRRIYDEGIVVEGTMKVTDTDTTQL
jgi:hypothetical protein